MSLISPWWEPETTNFTPPRPLADSERRKASQKALSSLVPTSDLDKALGLPKEDLKLLPKQIHSHDAAKLKEEMLELPAFREKVDARGWRDLIELAPQLMDAPRSLGQHVGGMILSESPISGMVPIRGGAVEGRYIIDWNKDSVADVNFAKIDLLSLPVLDQLEEALDLIEKRRADDPT